MSAQPLGEYFKDQEERRRSLHVLKANIHQGDPIVRENAGKQCTCNCLIFLIFAYTTHIICKMIMQDPWITYLKRDHLYTVKLQKCMGRST